MVTFLLQLPARPNKNLCFYVGKNVGMWAKMWAKVSTVSPNSSDAYGTNFLQTLI
jgi:hypothetical protein